MIRLKPTTRAIAHDGPKDRIYGNHLHNLLGWITTFWISYTMDPKDNGVVRFDESHCPKFFGLGRITSNHIECKTKALTFLPVIPKISLFSLVFTSTYIA